jgi:peptidoglycan/LPS O-acetylase OafA/YrhL
MAAVKHRYESLDVARGLAALVVVLSHWNVFYYRPGDALVDMNAITNAITLPFGRISWFFCEKGYLAVDLFFCLSGFIFFHLYRASIKSGRVSAGQFAVLRFSRLYPLHVATLFMVCVMEAVYFNRYGVFLAKIPADVPHFILQLGFVSNWWPGSLLTFNGPIWSVSIEVLLYILFFIAAQNFALRIETVAAASVAGFILLIFDDDLGRGVSMFYMGGLACYLVEAIANGKVPRSLIVAIAVVAVAALVILKGSGARGYAGWFLMVFAFPGLIVTLACAEGRIERWVHPFRWLGNVSYSTYLLHFPLIFLIMLLGIAHPSSRWFFLAFMIVLISISLASFRWFEFPAQQYLRSKLLSKRNAREPATTR